MTLRTTFLGTGGAVPTTRRAPSAVMVHREGERFLFDCGEGTQRQMMRFNTGFDVRHVFLTHLHGDHVLGLPGLLQTWDFQDRTDSLAIHCPPGSRRTIRDLIGAGGHDTAFPVRINEVSPGSVAIDGDEFEIRAFETEH
ncbi:MBL fold metallo-hydrolase, partial [Halolamina litorea]